MYLIAVGTYQRLRIFKSDRLVRFSLPSFETLKFPMNRTCLRTASPIINDVFEMLLVFLIIVVWGKFNYVPLLQVITLIVILLQLHYHNAWNLFSRQ
jgi:hypothetical protein